MSVASIFGITFNGDKMVSNAAFSPQTLTVAKSLMVRGDCFIKGSATCNIVRGANMNAPVILTSHRNYSTTAGDECWFTSPINGVIQTISYAVLSSALSNRLAVRFYNGDGVQASTDLDDNWIEPKLAQYLPHTATFDETNTDDYVFSNVGIGSTFCARVEFAMAAYTIVFTAVIDPKRHGGRYV